MSVKTKLTYLELAIAVAILLILLSMIMPILQVVSKVATLDHTINRVKNIGLIMEEYAEMDITSHKMPYPLPKGKEKAWGNSKKCWSTSIVEMLLVQNYIKKENLKDLKSSSITSKNYKPMYLNDNTELDFQLYCDKDLTSSTFGHFILVATYDNENIKNCQFNGEGWVVFDSDRTTQFIKRKKLNDYNSTSKTEAIISVNEVEGTMTNKDIILRKNIPESEGGPGTFGNMLGGGSTELMGKRNSDAIYKALVR